MSAERSLVVIRPGEESTHLPRREQVYLFPDVAFEDFLGKIAGKGFDNFACLYSSDPEENYYFATGIGEVKMVFTDGVFSDPFVSKPSDFYPNYRPKGASYVAHIKQPPEEPLPFARPGLVQAQVVIVSHWKSKEARKLFKKYDGLGDINIFFSRC